MVDLNHVYEPKPEYGGLCCGFNKEAHLSDPFDSEPAAILGDIEAVRDNG